MSKGEGMSTKAERIAELERELAQLKRRPEPAAGQVWRNCRGILFLVVRDDETEGVHSSTTIPILRWVGLTAQDLSSSWLGVSTTRMPPFPDDQYVGMIGDLLKVD